MNIERLANRLRSFRYLAPNWDGDGAPPIHRATCVKALELLIKMQEVAREEPLDLLLRAVSPGQSGDVIMDFEAKDLTSPLTTFEVLVGPMIIWQVTRHSNERGQYRTDVLTGNFQTRQDTQQISIMMASWISLR